MPKSNIAGVMSENIPPPPDYRLWAHQNLPRGDSELYPRGRLRWLTESTPPSEDLHPCIVIILSVFGFQNLPLPPRIYPTFQQL